ncbi:MAG: TraR/DksA family transcriptional regulator [Ilumatobacteraceae bacterium]|nr:TraR/DksA family transcriptional regulator [Ilumatobacteraceae bacterium]
MGMASTPGLSVRQRRALRTRVLEELSASEHQIASLSRSFDDIVDAATLTNTDDEHDPDGSTIAFERAQVSALLRQAREDEAALRRTLQRTDEPDFGMCAQCGQLIGVERLLALPSATRCISCAR